MSEVHTGKLSSVERVELTRVIMSILDSWGMNAQQQVELLNLPPKTPTRALRRYRENTPFPQTNEVDERLEHIVGIVDALRTTYPHNPSMGALWMKQRNKQFEDRAPLRVMVDEGLDGIMRIRAHLDCAYDWFNDSRSGAGSE